MGGVFTSKLFNFCPQPRSLLVDFNVRKDS